MIGNRINHDIMRDSSTLQLIRVMPCCCIIKSDLAIGVAPYNYLPLDISYMIIAKPIPVPNIFLKFIFPSEEAFGIVTVSWIAEDV